MSERQLDKRSRLIKLAEDNYDHGAMTIVDFLHDPEVEKILGVEPPVSATRERKNVTQALAAMQDARDMAKHLSGQGYERTGRMVLEAFRLADKAIIELEREADAALSHEQRRYEPEELLNVARNTLIPNDDAKRRALVGLIEALERADAPRANVAPRNIAEEIIEGLKEAKQSLSTGDKS